ncbi:MAG TPA: cupin domain-containing protein [Flavisolibacter sp.]|jgi:quercetin dioxygenase-like cupin family protein|nr:cupin domain-containing protein [Flavisolibacter sp.]
MPTEFKPNVDLMKVFNSQIMVVNNIDNSENGQILIKAGADGPPIHLHPEQEEYFQVVSGQLEVYHKNKWVTLKTGEKIFTPKNTAHSYRSRHTADCLFTYHLTPRRNFSDMLRTFEQLTTEQKLNSTSDIKSIIYLALTFKKFRSEITSVTPPHFVINIMAGIGNLLGFKV